MNHFKGSPLQIVLTSMSVSTFAVSFFLSYIRMYIYLYVSFLCKWVYLGIENMHGLTPCMFLISLAFISQYTYVTCTFLQATPNYGVSPSVTTSDCKVAIIIIIIFYSLLDLALLFMSACMVW